MPKSKNKKERGFWGMTHPFYGTIRFTPETTRDLVKDCVKSFKTVFVVKLENVGCITEKIQQKWIPSRFIYNSTSKLRSALTVAAYDTVEYPEYPEEFIKLTYCLTNGYPLLLFTDLSTEAVVNSLKEDYGYMYSVTGARATESIVLNKGDELKLGNAAATKLIKDMHFPAKTEEDVVTLLEDFELCKQGMPLTESQCKILRLVGRKIYNNPMRAVCCWNKDRGYEHISTLPCDIPEERRKKLEKKTIGSISNKKECGSSKVDKECLNFVEDIEEEDF